MATFLGHTNIVYGAVWSPLVPRCFASVSGDGTLMIWNTAAPQAPALKVDAHQAEVLSCDWCKYQQHILVTGGSDGLVRGWDTRKFGLPIFEQFVSEKSKHNLKIV